jgi:hypothetical protein
MTRSRNEVGVDALCKIGVARKKRDHEQRRESDRRKARVATESYGTWTLPMARSDRKVLVAELGNVN